MVKETTGRSEKSAFDLHPAVRRCSKQVSCYRPFIDAPFEATLRNFYNEGKRDY
jgi:hypothetical protein